MGSQPIRIGSETLDALRERSNQTGEPIVRLAQRLGVAAERIRIAVRYYAEFPGEIDRWIVMVDEDAERLRETLERERRLLK